MTKSRRTESLADVPFTAAIAQELPIELISAFFGLAGLVFLVVGIVGEHLPVLASENGILLSEKAWLTNWSPLGYRYWGIILILAATLLAVICLTLFAREGDRDVERAARRAQRLGIAPQDENKPE